MKINIFRNYLGAFSPSSSLQVLVEFGPTAAQKPKVLVVTLYDDSEEVRCELVILLAWSQGQALLNLQHCAGDQFQPGLWTLQGNICLISPPLITEVEPPGGIRDRNSYRKDITIKAKKCATSLILCQS